MQQSRSLVPTFAELAGWAGEHRIVRATPEQLDGWRLPPAHKAALVESGVPKFDGIIATVVFRAEPSHYRLAEDGEGTAFAAEPETGRVIGTYEPGGQTWLVNSSIEHWLASLHLIGTVFAASTALDRWDQDGQAEEAAIGELAELVRGIGRLDPAAVGDGDHERFFWPAVLDRWLY